jgi:CRISPR-associated protein Cas1
MTVSSFSSLPALRLRIRLCLTAPASFHFHHGGVLRGLLSRALGEHQLPVGCIPFASELGRVRFESGDPYHLVVTLLGDDRALAERWVAGLRRVGEERWRGRGAPPTLSGNFEVEGVEPLVVEEPEAAALRWADELGDGLELAVRFLSPLRLERPEELKRPGAGYLNQDCFPVEHFLSRLWNRCFFVQEGRWPEEAERAAMPPVPESAVAEPRGLVWLDVPVDGAARKGRRYTLGGVLGEVGLRGLSADWLPVLAAGRLVHAGADTSFGFGAYEVVGPRPVAGPWSRSEPLVDHPLAPARSFLAAVAEPEALDRALDHVLADSRAAGVDRQRPEDFADGGHAALERLAAELASGQYRPSALSGWWQRKDDGRLRPLATPTVRDRAAQRAACEAIGPSVDALLEDCSYAYRKGFSRGGAARAIQRAYERGYRYVLDADITAFFDSVDRDRLGATLRSLFPFEPLVPLLDAWAAVPVVFEGRTLERRRGLPQGSPVSPLLANLYLDELDEELLGRDYKLVRYSDDFVVLTKSLEEARRARDDARRALADLGLDLHEGKTEIRSLEDGFTYLGYLFCRSMALDLAGTREEPEGKNEPLEPSDVPAGTWLSQVPFDRLRVLADRGSKGDRRRRIEAVPLASPRAADARLGRPLYLSNPAARLRLAQGTLEVSVPGEGTAGEEELRLPIQSLSHVVVCGRARATVPLLLGIAAKGVPTFFCRRSGELYAMLGPHEPDWHLWALQAERARDEPRRVELSRELIGAKLHNQATLVRRFGWHGEDGVVEAIRELERQVANKTTREALLGLEGRGSALYFQALAGRLAEMEAEGNAEPWGFAGRERRPPPDPINAMLSFAYTLLHNHLVTALTIRGLNPRVGVLHDGRGTHDALASDLLEEWRWLAEALVWSLVRRGRIQPSDFEPSPDLRWPCLLKRKARRRFLQAFEARLHTEFTPEAAGGAEPEPITYREHLAAQALQLRRWTTGEVARYLPLRLHA